MESIREQRRRCRRRWWGGGEGEGKVFQAKDLYVSGGSSASSLVAHLIDSLMTRRFSFSLCHTPTHTHTPILSSSSSSSSIFLSFPPAALGWWGISQRRTRKEVTQAKQLPPNSRHTVYRPLPLPLLPLLLLSFFPSPFVVWRLSFLSSDSSADRDDAAPHPLRCLRLREGAFYCE